MKGRMFVVNQETIQTTMDNNIASIITPDLNGKMWLKTIADIMADMLQIEIGDYIFLWETSSTGRKSQIYGVYRAISKPFYEVSNENDDAPFKIYIEKAYDFEQPIDEYDVLNNPYVKNDLWTIIGKKVAGKSRGTSPLSPDEVKHLITLLIGKNENYKYTEFDSSRVINVPKPLAIDYGKRGVSPQPLSLSSFHPNDLCYIDITNNNVKYEKILETIFNQEMSKRNKDFFSQIGINVDKVVWYSNYLPYSIEQSEMDYVIIESDDGYCISRIFVIELQKERIDNDHIQRCLLYSKWVNDTLALGTNNVQPILICSESCDFLNDETSKVRQKRLEQNEATIKKFTKEYSVKDLQIFEYSLVPNRVFKRKR